MDTPPTLRPTSIPRSLTLDDLLAVVDDDRVAEDRASDRYACSAGRLTAVVDGLLCDDPHLDAVGQYAVATVVLLPDDEYEVLQAIAAGRVKA